jgi:hypothetical protein
MLGSTLGRVLHTDKSNGGCVMENYTPEWRNTGNIDAIQRARLLMVYAHEVRRTSIECRQQAAVLCDEAQSLRAEGLRAASAVADALPG